MRESPVTVLGNVSEEGESWSARAPSAEPWGGGGGGTGRRAGIPRELRFEGTCAGAPFIQEGNVLPGIGGQRGSTRKLGLKRLGGGGGRRAACRLRLTRSNPRLSPSPASPRPPLPRPGVGREGAAGRRTAGDEAGCFGGACGPIRLFFFPRKSGASLARPTERGKGDVGFPLRVRRDEGGLLPSFLPPFRRGLPLPSKESSPSAPPLPHRPPPG